MNAEADKLREWFQGDEAATRLFMDLGEVSQLADDLVDRDKGHALDDRRRLATRLLQLAIITIPANEFFRRFQGWLAPVLLDAVLAWDLSTSLEKSPRNSCRAFAYAYRDQIERAIVQAALLTGGLDHARRVQGEIFEFFRFDHADGQTFTDYCGGLEK